MNLKRLFVTPTQKCCPVISSPLKDGGINEHVSPSGFLRTRRLTSTTSTTSTTRPQMDRVDHNRKGAGGEEEEENPVVVDGGGVVVSFPEVNEE